MKKLIAIVSSLFLVTTISAKAEIGIGISGALHMFDADGDEITRQSGEINAGSHSEEALVPEVFIEAVSDNGFAFGLSYIPTRDVGSKSRSDTNSEGDTGTYKAAAELDDVIKVYVDIPLSGFNVFGGQGYVSAGINFIEDKPIGLIPIDAIFSPILQVSYDVDNARVGQQTDFDKLLLNVTNDG